MIVSAPAREQASTPTDRSPTRPPVEAAQLMAQARAATDLLKALSHEARLLVLCILSEGEKSVSELEEILELPQASVSQHLARLRHDNLVATRRDGRMIYYRIARPEVGAVIETLHRLFCDNTETPERT